MLRLPWNKELSKILMHLLVVHSSFKFRPRASNEDDDDAPVTVDFKVVVDVAATTGGLVIIVFS